jgi:hypothetical protein
VADDPNKAPGAPEDVEAIRLWLVAAFEEMDDEGRLVGDAKFGVYAFFDYDGEPIYVGQTREGLRTRIRRHLTNQRTDAVAMNVLDPFEVLEIAMWPLWELENSSLSAKEQDLSRQCRVHRLSGGPRSLQLRRGAQREERRRGSVRGVA